MIRPCKSILNSLRWITKRPLSWTPEVFTVIGSQAALQLTANQAQACQCSGCEQSFTDPYEHPYSSAIGPHILLGLSCVFLRRGACCLALFGVLWNFMGGSDKNPLGKFDSNL